MSLLTLDSEAPSDPESIGSDAFDPSVESYCTTRAASEGITLERLIRGYRRASAWPTIARLWLRVRRRETAGKVSFRDRALRGWWWRTPDSAGRATDVSRSWWVDP